MPAVKFGMFKSRSRDPEPRSAESLLPSSASSDTLSRPESPVASTSRAGLCAVDCPGDCAGDCAGAAAYRELAALTLAYEDDDEEPSFGRESPRRRASSGSLDATQLNYSRLADAPPTPSPDDVQLRTINDDDATSCDAASLASDVASLASDGAGCGRRRRKGRSREEQLMRDQGMWQASNVTVMQNLLTRSGSLDEQIKWEAIAAARGLCALTDNCACADCTRHKCLLAITDGDAGMGAAPLFNAISVGCSVQ